MTDATDPAITDFAAHLVPEAFAISGLDEVIGNGIVSTGPLGDAQQFVRGAKRVLRGHPSRRAYRLR